MKPYMYNLATIIGLSAIVPILYLVIKNGVYGDIGLGAPEIFTAGSIFVFSQLTQVVIELLLYKDRLSSLRIAALIIMVLLATFIPFFALVLNPMGAGITIVFYGILSFIGSPIVLVLCLIKPRIKISEGLFNPVLNTLASSIANYLCMASVT